ncbi:hypothetical protein DVH05_000119 [Phytophthora capsici]|nr:hypothetical protein DVH05_000119 [Phytophthora capsici]
MWAATPYFSSASDVAVVYAMIKGSFMATRNSTGLILNKRQTPPKITRMKMAMVTRGGELTEDDTDDHTDDDPATETYDIATSSDFYLTWLFHRFPLPKVKVAIR